MARRRYGEGTCQSQPRDGERAVHCKVPCNTNSTKSELACIGIGQWLEDSSENLQAESRKPGGSRLGIDSSIG